MKQNYIKQTSKPISCITIVHLIMVISLLLFSSVEAKETDCRPETGQPAGTCVIMSEDGRAEIPFDIYRGDIRFSTEINGHKVYLLLDDGYLWDQLLFWGGPEVDSLGFEYDGEINVGGGSDDANKLVSKTASGITVTFPGVEFSDQSAVITPYSSGNSTMWSGSVGQISAAFFKHCVVDINFDNKIITLIKPEKFEYTGKGVAIDWKPLEFGPRSIPATLTLADNRKIDVPLLMDLGYNDQLEINTAGINKIPLPEEVKPISLGMNIQRVERMGQVGCMPGVNIGGYELPDVVVGYYSDETKDANIPEVMIGLGLLSRFNLMFDFYNQKIYVEPNKTFSEPFKLE